MYRWKVLARLYPGALKQRQILVNIHPQRDAHVPAMNICTEPADKIPLQSYIKLEKNIWKIYFLRYYIKTLGFSVLWHSFIFVFCHNVKVALFSSNAEEKKL